MSTGKFTIYLANWPKESFLDASSLCCDECNNDVVPPETGLNPSDFPDEGCVQYEGCTFPLAFGAAVGCNGKIEGYIDGGCSF